MADELEGTVAVIFVSRQTGNDPAGYEAAARRMEALAAEQPGFRGIAAARDATGLGVTVSYWSDEAAALAWRDQPEHAAVREAGRNRWYDRYRVDVAGITRSYE